MSKQVLLLTLLISIMATTLTLAIDYEDLAEDVIVENILKNHLLSNLRLFKNQFMENNKNDDPSPLIRMLRSGTLGYRPRFGKRAQSDSSQNPINPEESKLSDEKIAFFG